MLKQLLCRRCHPWLHRLSFLPGACPRCEQDRPPSTPGSNDPEPFVYKPPPEEKTPFQIPGAPTPQGGAVWLYTRRSPYDRHNTYRLMVELLTDQEIPCKGVEDLVQIGLRITSKEMALEYVKFLTNNIFFAVQSEVYILGDGIIGPSPGMSIEFAGISPEAIAPTLAEMAFPWGAREFHVRRYALSRNSFSEEFTDLRSIVVVDETVGEDGSYQSQLSELRESDPPRGEWHRRFRGVRYRFLFLVPGRPLVLAGRPRRAELRRGSCWC